ncbi:hypothetical protein N7489_005097 [Penicillium chrysogenum]|uniref:uncharacterized protein n=1 Tax=Penicillium chrysogenum TaxID=5076 RepID=UPI0024DF2B59|nr:uncharacterized protein N7489_005097 [Penicillium chrysogenum]KAJ5245001.1 hypothetical protein N7489_005097 [Penicillium chrysogenum]
MAFGHHGKSKESHSRVPEKSDRHIKHSQSKIDSRRCTAQTDITAKASAALPKRLVEPATTPREAPGRNPT